MRRRSAGPAPAPLPAGADPARVSPEAVGVFGRPLRRRAGDVVVARHESPARSKPVSAARISASANFEREPNPTRDLIRVVEQCASGCAANGNIPGLVYRSQDFSVAYTGSYLWKGSVSYVTGTHSLKVGYQHTLMTDDRTWMTNNQNLTYRFNNGVPNQLTQSISPWVNNARAAWERSFVQEHWTRDRLTLQGARAVRPRAELVSRAAGRPVADSCRRRSSFRKRAGVDSYKDITPRLGAAYDLFGDGRTALKVTLGRYLEGAGVVGHLRQHQSDAADAADDDRRSARQA